MLQFQCASWIFTVFIYTRLMLGCVLLVLPYVGPVALRVQPLQLPAEGQYEELQLLGVMEYIYIFPRIWHHFMPFPDMSGSHT